MIKLFVCAGSEALCLRIVLKAYALFLKTNNYSRYAKNMLTLQYIVNLHNCTASQIDNSRHCTVAICSKNTNDTLFEREFHSGCGRIADIDDMIIEHDSYSSVLKRMTIRAHDILTLSNAVLI